MNIRDSFIDFLNTNGITFQSEGNVIQFDWEDLHYVLLYTEDDPAFFRLMLPRVETFTEENTARLNEVAMELSTRFKVGKMIRYDQDNTLWISIENFIYTNSGDDTRFFTRAMRLLKYMYDDFVAAMNPQQDAENEAAAQPEVVE